MPVKKTVKPADRRHRDYLRRKGLQVASVYEKRLAKARRKELRRVLDLTRDYRDPGMVLHLLEDGLDETGYLPGWWTGLWTDAGLPYAKTTAQELREAKAAEEDDLWLSSIRRYAQTRAGNEIRIVSGTWKDSLVKIARTIMEEDPTLGVEKLAKRIFAKYQEIAQWQVRRIAQTEAMIGMAEAGDMAAHTLDVPFVKEWVISGLGNTRPSHEAMDGTIVDQEELFRLEGGLMMYPHDTSHGADAGEIINCACDVLRIPKKGGKMFMTQPSGKLVEGPSPVEAPTPTVVLTPEQQREARLQEIMKEMGDDIPEASRRAIAESDLAWEKELGITKGKPMGMEQADEKHSNPNFGKPGYDVNCATCSPTYLMRTRGFDVTANPNTSAFAKVVDLSWGDTFTKKWKNADGTAVIPESTLEWMKKKGYKKMTGDRYMEFVKEKTAKAGIYEMNIGWKGCKSDGHSFIIQKTAKGGLVAVDAQTGEHSEELLKSYLNGGKTTGFSYFRGILRIDDKILNTAYSSIFAK